MLYVPNSTNRSTNRRLFRNVHLPLVHCVVIYSVNCRAFGRINRTWCQCRKARTWLTFLCSKGKVCKSWKIRVNTITTFITVLVNISRQVVFDVNFICSNGPTVWNGDLAFVLPIMTPKSLRYSNSLAWDIPSVWPECIKSIASWKQLFDFSECGLRRRKQFIKVFIDQIVPHVRDNAL